MFSLSPIVRAIILLFVSASIFWHLDTHSCSSALLRRSQLPESPGGAPSGHSLSSPSAPSPPSPPPLPLSSSPQSPYQITLLTAISPGEYQNQYRHALSSRQCYASAHGYAHIIDVQRYPRPVEARGYDWSWGKVHAAIQHMETKLAQRAGASWAGGGEGGRRGPPAANEWLFLIDADFVIQRMATRLEDFFDPVGSYDLLVSDNLSNEINMGFFAARVGEVALAVLKRLRSLESKCPDGWWLMEQSAFNYMLAVELQEKLCPGTSAPGFAPPTALPIDHDACKFDLARVLTEPGACFDPSPVYMPFFKLLPPDIWSYGKRAALPWLHAYFYRGDDKASPLVDFNRFDEHSAQHNPLSQRTDWGSHSKHMQKSYQALMKDMDSIGAEEPFCKALYNLRP